MRPRHEVLSVTLAKGALSENSILIPFPSCSAQPSAIKPVRCALPCRPAVVVTQDRIEALGPARRLDNCASTLGNFKLRDTAQVQLSHQHTTSPKLAGFWYDVALRH